MNMLLFSLNEMNSICQGGQLDFLESQHSNCNNITSYTNFVFPQPKLPKGAPNEFSAHKSGYLLITYLRLPIRSFSFG